MFLIIGGFKNTTELIASVELSFCSHGRGKEISVRWVTKLQIKADASFVFP